MRPGMETLCGIRYTVQMMVVPLSGPFFTYGDNISVVYITQRPESILKKTSTLVCYHALATRGCGNGEFLV
jgi:hypothetical protein